jgi:N6-L-threonylcarbamoyladenine synthase
LAQSGDPGAFNFPLPNLYKGDHRYDLSYSGLKNAVINQLEQFRVRPRPEGGGGENEKADIAASFQKTAVGILLKALFNAAEDTGLKTIVAGGGAAANSLLRAKLVERRDLRCIFPPLELCGDNGAMVAGFGCRLLERDGPSPLTVTASARVTGFKRRYP